MALQRFADYAAGLTVTDLPEDAIHAAKRAVIDWFASTLPGGLEPPATMLGEAFQDSTGAALLYPSGRGAAAPTVRKSCTLRIAPVNSAGAIAHPTLHPVTL